MNPDLARGTLAYLAATQAVAASPEQDAEPGKILHETRTGEMARSRRGALRAVLRQRGRDAAVRDPRGLLLRAHRRSGVHRGAVGTRRPRPALDRRARRRRRGRLRRIRAPQPDRPGAPGVEGLQRLGQPQGWHARGRADCALRGAGLRLRGQAAGGPARGVARASRIAPACWRARPRSCASGSIARSGRTSSAPTRWLSTGRKRRATSARRMPAIVCSPASPTRPAPAAWPRR